MLKGFLKGAKKFMKNSAEKVVSAVDSILENNVKARKIGVLVVSVGIGIVAMSYINA